MSKMNTVGLKVNGNLGEWCKEREKSGIEIESGSNNFLQDSLNSKLGLEATELLMFWSTRD